LATVYGIVKQSGGHITGGALALDGTRWIPTRPTFLFPVRALAKVFRGRYLAGLRRAFDQGDLHLTGGLAPLAEPAAFAAWLEELRAQAWVVYCAHFGDAEHPDRLIVNAQIGAS